MTDEGIIDPKRNPFGSDKSGRPKSWVSQGYGLTDRRKNNLPSRKERLQPLFGKDIEGIKKIGE